MRALALLALAACSSKPAGALDVLREPGRAWVYEVVRGPAIDQLAPVANAVRAVCSVRAWSHAQLPKTMSTSELRCAPTARGPSQSIHAKHIFLVFDADGVRELPGPGSPPTDKSFALGFTFPAKLAGTTWAYERGDRVRSRVEVRAATAQVLGKERAVWISSSTYEVDEEPPRRGAAMFAPGVAPVLLCDVDIELTCLRLIAVAAPKQRPALAKRRPSRAEREELARWLQTIDVEPDVLGEVLPGQLVVRDDLPARELAVRPVLEVDATALRYRGEQVMLGELLVELNDARHQLRDSIARGVVPNDADLEALQRQIVVAIAADTPWQRVTDVLEVVALTGFTQPQFLFARTPRTPAPPKHPIDDVVAEAALAGNAAELLGSLTRDNLADCEALRAAFAVDGWSDKRPARQLVEQVSAMLPKADCRFDLPALRATLWNTLGTRYPVAILPVELADDAPALVLPASTPWREASKHVTPNMTLEPAVTGSTPDARGG